MSLVSRLRRFHSAGHAVKNATLGVPRLRELTRAKITDLETPSVTVRLLDPWCRETSAPLLTETIHALTRLTLKDVAAAPPVVVDARLDPPDDLWTELLSDELSLYSDWAVAVPLDMELLKLRHMSCEDVAFHLHSWFGFEPAPKIPCPPLLVTTDPVAGHLQVRLALWFLTPHVTAGIAERRALELWSEFAWKTCVLREIEGIKQVHLRRELQHHFTPSEGHVCSKHLVMDTDGANLAAMLALPFTNVSRTVSNDIHETARVLGITAAQPLLASEINGVISFDGTSINPAHVDILVAAMVRTGRVKASSRHGIKDQSQLSRAVFEEALRTIYKAATTAADDDVRHNITEAMIFGSRPPVGTGFMDARAAPGVVIPDPVAGSINIAPLSDGEEEDKDDSDEGPGLFDDDEELCADLQGLRIVGDAAAQPVAGRHRPLRTSGPVGAPLVIEPLDLPRVVRDAAPASPLAVSPLSPRAEPLADLSWVASPRMVVEACEACGDAVAVDGELLDVSSPVTRCPHCL